MIEIVFSDVDGTLLNTAHRVTPATRAALLALGEVPFVIVSARSPSGLYPILRRNGFTCPLIAYSGALIQDERGEILYQRGMEPALAGEILAFLETERLPVTWCLYAGDDWLVKDRSSPAVRREEEIVEAQSRAGSLKDLPPTQRVHKILCICAPGTIDDTRRRIQSRFPSVNAVQSSDILLELMDRGVNKAEAVRFYCDRLGIRLTNAAAFGDNYNDWEMLEAVGHPVVMGNAPAPIRARFRRVTADNDHDGIAAALRAFAAEGLLALIR